MDVGVSPYCAKTEVYLRRTGRQYTTENGNTLKSPNNLVPYVRWGDGSVQADSDPIVAEFEAKGPNSTMD